MLPTTLYIVTEEKCPTHPNETMYVNDTLAKAEGRFLIIL